jgi:hypothetical protein
MRVTSNSSTPSAFVIELYLGAKKAVRVFPEWQLPSLHSQGFLFYLFIYYFYPFLLNMSFPLVATPLFALPMFFLKF